MSDWIEYKNEKGQTVYFNKTVRLGLYKGFNRLESQVWRSLDRDPRCRHKNRFLNSSLSPAWE